MFLSIVILIIAAGIAAMAYLVFGIENVEQIPSSIAWGLAGCLAVLFALGALSQREHRGRHK